MARAARSGGSPILLIHTDPGVEGAILVRAAKKGQPQPRVPTNPRGDRLRGGAGGNARPVLSEGLHGPPVDEVEHTAEIAAEYGYREFTAAEAELVQWVVIPLVPGGGRAIQARSSSTGGMCPTAHNRRVKLALEGPPPPHRGRADHSER